MNTKYVDTSFGNLIMSYAFVCDGLTDEEIEMALRKHAEKWGGCIACRYSIRSESEGKGNIWLMRGCQLGFSQDDCNCFAKFPEEK